MTQINEKQTEALRAFFSNMASGKTKAHSELQTRDEAKQFRTFEKRIQQFKATTGLKSRVLVMKDVAFPFNPFTCEPDEEYNDTNKFRPILLPSQVIAGLKDYCSTHAEIAAKWESILGASMDWSAPVSLDDYYKFKHAGFIFPRINTYFTVMINFNGKFGFPEFATRYLVDPKGLNSDYFYDRENAPVWHQATTMFMSMIRPEIAEMETEAKKNGASKETIAVRKREIRSKCPVGVVTPTNVMGVIYLPFDTPVRDINTDNYKEFEPFMRWMKYNPEKWNTALSEVKKNDSLDDLIDYYDFTLSTPDSTTKTSKGTLFTDKDHLELFQAMVIQVTDGRNSLITGKSSIDGKLIDNKDLYSPVLEAANKYFIRSQEQSALPDGDTFEKVMALSVNFRPIESVAERIPEASNAVFLAQFANTKYFTEDIKMANKEFFSLMNSDMALELAAHDDDVLDAAAAAQAEKISSVLQDMRDSDADAGFPDLTNLKISDT